MIRTSNGAGRRGAQLALLLLCYTAHVRAQEPAAVTATPRGPVAANATPPPGAAAQPGARPGTAQVTLEASEVRGNQELPKVLYIVPWKDPAMVEVVGRPVNSLVDEALAPVDRDVFRRQGRYFAQLYGAGRKPGDRDGTPPPP